MPKKGQYDQTYPDKLQEIGIVLLEEFCGAKKHHLMKCIDCGHEWRATPLSKLQNYKRHGVGGCKPCTIKRNTDPKKEIFLKKLQERFVLLSDYDGSQLHPVPLVKVQNKKCGHIFTSNPRNLVNSQTECPICNKEEKIKRLNKSSKERSEEFHKTAPEWVSYRKKVRLLTEKTYRKHIDILNPNNLPRGLAGEEGVYHLDHIKSIKDSFLDYDPPEECAHLNNLQLLTWEENMTKK